MHEAKPYGHLLLNGKSVEDDALARMTGASADEVSALMAELRKAGVFNVTREGIIFSRRMTKDHARASKGRKAVQKRWAQVDDIKEKSSAPNRLPNTEPITQKPDTRIHIIDANASILSDFDREFETEIWPVYPRKVGKGQALKAYRGARKKTNGQIILAGVRRYAAERAGEDPQFTKHAATWLNGQCWSDEPAPPHTPKQQAPPFRERTVLDAVNDRLREEDAAHYEHPTIDHEPIARSASPADLRIASPAQGRRW